MRQISNGKISLFDKMQLNYEYYRSILSLKNKGINVPVYSSIPIVGTAPVMYNEYGEKIHIFFLRDEVVLDYPYFYCGRHHLFDRYNYGLAIHFYTNKMMLTQIGKPIQKYGIMLESRAVYKRDYAIIDRNISHLKEFVKVFTYDDQLLNTLENAVFVPFAASIAYRNGEYIIGDETAYERKEKNVSIISSEKVISEMHKRRRKLAFECRKKDYVDTFGTFDGSPWIPSIDEVFEKYRYSIAIENAITDYYFTEKILNCFAAQTIPIYLGAKKIGDYFNPEGIIQIKVEDLNDIDAILKMCTPEEYERRLPAIKDNFERVKRYRNSKGDILYDTLMGQCCPKWDSE